MKEKISITFHSVNTVSGPRSLWKYLRWHYRAENQVQVGLRREGGPESKIEDADLNIIPSLYNK